MALKGSISGLYKAAARLYLAPILVREWKRPLFSNINERPIEYGFVFDQLAELCPAEVLDVGTGRSALPHLMANCGFRVTAIDKAEGYWRGRLFNRHYYIIKDDIANPRINKRFDLITCISVLEHIPDHRAAIRGMFGLLRSGGHLVLTFPYNERHYVENVYKLPGAGYGQDRRYICQVYSRDELNEWLAENGGRIVAQEYYEVFSGDFWTFGERIYPPCKVSELDKHHLTCLVLQKG